MVNRELMRTRREALGMLQPELAFRLDTKQEVISKWERGATSPRVASLVAWCRELGVEPNEALVGWGKFEDRVMK